MKKIFLAAFIITLFLSAFHFFSKQNNEENASFPLYIRQQVEKYAPLKQRNIDATAFFDNIENYP